MHAHLLRRIVHLCVKLAEYLDALFCENRGSATSRSSHPERIPPKGFFGGGDPYRLVGTDSRADGFISMPSPRPVEVYWQPMFPSCESRLGGKTGLLLTYH
jgi:hypothetical protein